MFEDAKKVTKKRLCITISQEIFDLLDSVVESKGLDKSKLIEVILKDYLTRD